MKLGQDIETFPKISDCFLVVYREQLICGVGILGGKESRIFERV